MTDKKGIHIGHFEEGTKEHAAGTIVVNLPIDGYYYGVKMTLAEQRELQFLLNAHIQDFEMTRTTEVMLHSYGEEAEE
jgi:hypothetical protein